MKQILSLFLIFTLLLSVSLISAHGGVEEHEEHSEKLNIFEKFIRWFKSLFRSNTKTSTILEEFNEEVEFYKSKSCGCCGAHSKYLDNKGLNFEVINVDDISEIKDEYNIPDDLRSCHTIILGDYFVEGHMPTKAIEKLITEKPDIAGIALAGMPTGAPGMPGKKTETWIIYAVNHDGTSQEFMRI